MVKWRKRKPLSFGSTDQLVKRHSGESESHNSFGGKAEIGGDEDGLQFPDRTYPLVLTALIA